MKHPRQALTPQRIREAKRPGMYADGNGLYLRVDPTGAKRWVQRITIAGRRRNLGLGGWPVVSLKDARAQAWEHKRAVRDGGDPLVDKRRRQIITFAEATQRVIDLHRPEWSSKNLAAWQRLLPTHAFPAFGDRPVGDVTREEIFGLLASLWLDKHPTARKLRQHISTVMGWAVNMGLRSDNPVDKAMADSLPSGRKAVSHYQALHYTEVPHAVAAVRDSDATPVTRLSLEFLILTVARSGEVRQAQWDEIDWPAKTWTVPASRMKASREHRIPLPDRAVAVLRDAASLGDDSGLIFPGQRPGRPLSDMTHRKLLRSLQIDAVPHGFRSSFRDWAAEQTDAPHAVMEAALAHVVSNTTEAAYARSDLFHRRRTLMDAWAAYLGSRKAADARGETAVTTSNEWPTV